jgi:hypothetical protein
VVHEAHVHELHVDRVAVGLLDEPGTRLRARPGELNLHSHCEVPRHPVRRRRVDAEGLAIGPSWPSLAAGNLQELDALAWFDASDPVNRTFRDAHNTAAGGSFPSPV